MGKGKARRRRQANYEAAHKVVKLAPPPCAKDVAAVPSKLRTIMKLMAPQQENGGLAEQEAVPKKIKKGQTLSPKEIVSKITADDSLSWKKNAGDRQKTAEDVLASRKDVEHSFGKADGGDEGSEAAQVTEVTKKRKRNESLEQFGETLKAQAPGSRGRERRKKYLKEKKEKKKKTHEDTSLKQLYQQDQVKFGEVVDAPPKLPRLRKEKRTVGVSQERLRLQAVETYRQKRGWESRPGLALPGL